MDAKKVIAKGKKAIKKNIKAAQIKGGELEKMAMKEYATIKKQMGATIKKADSYVKKNPKKAAAIAAGIGAALGVVAGILASSAKKGKKK